MGWRGWGRYGDVGGVALARECSHGVGRRGVESRGELDEFWHECWSIHGGLRREVRLCRLGYTHGANCTDSTGRVAW